MGGGGTCKDGGGRVRPTAGRDDRRASLQVTLLSAHVPLRLHQLLRGDMVHVGHEEPRERHRSTQQRLRHGRGPPRERGLQRRKRRHPGEVEQAAEAAEKVPDLHGAQRWVRTDVLAMR